MTKHNPAFPYFHNIIVNFNIQANNILDNINNLTNKINNLHSIRELEKQNNSPDNIIDEINQEITFISKQIIKQQNLHNKLNQSIQNFIKLSKKTEAKYKHHNKWAINKIFNISF